MSNDFDPADFDDPPDPRPTPAEQARALADAANASRLLTNILAEMRQILATMSRLDAVAADLRAMMADADAHAARRSEDEAARDKQITDRLIDPRQLAAYAAEGAKRGVTAALAETIEKLTRQLDDEGADRKRMLARVDADHAKYLDQIRAERADRLADELRRRKHDGYRNMAVASGSLLILAAFTGGFELGNINGNDTGYARARDEIAAVSWANTPNGKLARRIDQTSPATIPDIAACPKANGWHSEKRQGFRYCFATNPDRKSITGWPMP